MSKMIVVEGIEGAGKSSILRAIQEFLINKQHKFLTTREPGGTEIGEQLRDILKNKSNSSMHSKTELLLMYASRNQLYNEKILPALSKGTWIVSDRFELSSYAYQGYGRNLPINNLITLSNLCLTNFKPDVTFFLDVSYDLSQQRITKRGIIKDRIEQEHQDFFERVRQGYLELARNDETIKVIDASQDLVDVERDVLSKLELLCP